MALARPLALLLLPAVGVLVWLYLRQPRGRPVVVPSLLLWSQVQTERVRAQRWRPDLSFLLRVVILLAVIFGLAEPYRPEVPSAAPRRILVVDVSAGMQATTGGSSRGERAVAAARASLRDDESVAVVRSAQRAELVLGSTAERRTVDAALADLVPGDASGGPAPGLQLARRLAAAAAEPATIEVFTDRPGAAAIAAQASDAVVHIVGDERRNVGIVSLVVQQGPFATPRQATAAVEVRNFGDKTEHRSLTIDLGDRTLAQEGFTLEPGATRRIDLGNFAAAGVVTARLQLLDAFVVDDRAVAVIAPRRVVHWAQTGLSDANLRAFERLTQALGWREFGAGAPVESPDVAIVQGGADELPVAPGVLVVQPARPLAGVKVADWLTDVRLVDWNDHHASLAGLQPTLGRSFARVRELVAPADAEVLLWGEADGRNVALAIAGATAEAPYRRTVLLAFDPGEAGLLANDDPSTTLLMAGLLAWLRPGADAASAVPVGTIVDPPAGATHVVLPSGERAPLPAGSGFELDRLGLYRFVAAAGETWVAAQLADARESQLQGSTPAAAPDRSSPVLPVARPPAGDAAWMRAAYLLALAVLGFDWWWAVRRREGVA